MREHPLRRRYGLELGLGLGLAGLAAWLVLAREPGERGQEPEEPAADAPLPRADVPPLEPEEAALVHVPEELAKPARVASEEVEPGPELVVFVRAADGTPRAGVELELTAWHGGQAEPSADNLGWSVSQGEEGRARFALEREPFRAHLLGHTLTCLEPFLRSVELELGPELPPEPVTLVLLPHGTVAVQVTRDGRPVTHPVRVDLAARAGGASLAQRSREAVRGSVSFPVVGLGLELELLAWCEESGASEPVFLSGPVRDGELVTVSLALAPVAPLVTLRVVDERGRPLAGEPFEGWIDYGASSLPLTSTPRSDERGRIEFHLPGEPGDGSARALVLRSARPERPGEPPRPHARLSVPDPLDGRRTTDLGRIVLAARPGQEPAAPAPDQVLVAGLVQDERGRPLPGARVYLVALPAPWDLEGTSDEQGRFEFRAEEWPGDCRLSARATRFQPVDRVLKEPATDLVVTLPAAAILRGRLLLEPGFPLQDLRLGLAGPGGAELPSALDFQHEELAPGTYQLRIRAGTGQRLLESFRDIGLGVGENGVRVFDLRGKLTPVRLELRLPEGKPLDGLFEVHIGDDTELWRAEAGHVHGCVRAGETLALFLEGYRWLRVDPAAGEQRLEFEPE